MKKYIAQRVELISVGMAMFTMFFGAGNVVFPLLIGQTAQDFSIYAILGLLITAVGVPFLGLIAVSLYNGDYRQFFSRFGATPAFTIIAVIMALIGPFGALPRCIALSFSTTNMFFENVSIIPFSLACCVLIFVCTVRKNAVGDLLGLVLTPFLLGTLGIIIIKGLISYPETIISTEHTAFSAFLHGLYSGYHTMDLLGALFFSSVVVHGLKEVSSIHGIVDKKQFFKNTFLASLLGAGLLAIVYVGMCFVAAKHASSLSQVPAEFLLGTIALNVLGSWAGITTCVAVVLACLTTAMALATVFAEFLSRDVCCGKVSYPVALAITLLIAFGVSTLEFRGIFQLLAPIVQTIYPVLFVMTVWNIVAIFMKDKR